MAPPDGTQRGKPQMTKSRIARSRLAWFIALYVIGLAAFTAVVYGLRALVPR